MDDQNHGDKDLKDCVAGKDFFSSTGVIDMDKVGIIGGSYGGYMVMAALSFEPDAFDVGVNIFGKEEIWVECRSQGVSLMWVEVELRS